MTRSSGRCLVSISRYDFSQPRSDVLSCGTLITYSRCYWRKLIRARCTPRIFIGEANCFLRVVSPSRISRLPGRTRVCLQDRAWLESWDSRCPDTACLGTPSTRPPGWRVMEKVINGTVTTGGNVLRRGGGGGGRWGAILWFVN